MPVLAELQPGIVDEVEGVLEKTMSPLTGVMVADPGSARKFGAAVGGRSTCSIRPSMLQMWEGMCWAWDEAGRDASGTTCGRVHGASGASAA